METKKLWKVAEIDVQSRSLYRIASDERYHDKSSKHQQFVFGFQHFGSS